MREVKSFKELLRKFSSSAWVNGLIYVHPPKTENWKAFKDIAPYNLYYDNSVSYVNIKYDIFISSLKLSYEYKIPILISRWDYKKCKHIYSTIKYTENYCMVRHNTCRMVYNKFEKKQLELYQIMSNI